MKLLLLLLLLFLSSGCRTYYYSRIDSNQVRHEVWITSILSSSTLSAMEIRVDTNVLLRLEGYSQTVDDKAIQAITDGVVSGIMHGIK